MKYNLDGQRGPAGEINPDNLAAGPYIYDSPPGLGDNKGLTSDKKPVDPEQHKTKQTGEPSLLLYGSTKAFNSSIDLT